MIKGQEKNLYILGLNCLSDHDSSVALLDNGIVVAAAAEERFTRIKQDPQFPHRALEYCLNRANIDINNISKVGFSWDVKLSGVFRAMSRSSGRSVSEYLNNAKNAVFFHRGLAQFQIGAERILRQKYGYSNEFVKVPHHLCHAAAAYNLSGYGDAAILTIDGTGECDTATFNYASKCNINKLGEVSRPHSLGLLYGEVTGYLGFNKYSDEYKVMGLAAYGKPVYQEKFSKVIRLMDRGRFRLNLKYFTMYGDFVAGLAPLFIDEFGPPRKRDQAVDERSANIACSLQKTIEDAVCHMAQWLADNTKCQNLCLSGGVSLNGVANAEILRRRIFKSIFIDPAADDSGTSLGAAAYICNLAGLKVRPTSNYWGPEYSSQYIEETLAKCKVRYIKLDNTPKACAELLAQGRIIGWFQGRMEWGPRALGNRSILADPREPKMKELVNASVKYREGFRPFAPAVLQERADEYFIMPQPEIPHMNVVVRVREEKKRVIPAVTHVDGTARVQTVTSDFNPMFRKAIEEFSQLTGVPVILNTSFNIKGEPIVCSPDDALRCFYGTGMDCLIIGEYLVRKGM